MKQIEAGRYEFFASHIGYLEQQYKAKVPGGGEGAALSLTSSQEVSDVLFRLVLAGVITGKVLDDGGEPMMGVAVSVLRGFSAEDLEDAGPRGRKHELASVSIGSTDDRGEYRIYGLQPGEYYVKAAEATDPPNSGPTEIGGDWMLLHELGSQYAPLFYPGVMRADQAQEIRLSAGEEMRADFAMRRIKVTEVSGHVIGADGTPATNAYVALRIPIANDWGGDLSSSTDSQGEVSIKGVAPGSYILSASESDRGRRHYVQQKVEVGEEKINSIVLAIGRGAHLHGRIIVSGSGTTAYERVQVDPQSVSEEETSNYGMTEVNKDGSFDLEGVPDGSYMLRTGGLEQGWYVKSAHLGSEDVMQNGLQIENGGVAGRLDVVISSDGAQIEGTVTDNDKNQPLAGVQVGARLDPVTDYNRYRSRESVTDQNGHFVLKDVPPGKYRVTAKLPSSGDDAPAIKSDPVAITVSEREHRILDFKLTLPKSE